jgi:ribosomal protein S18 acetylase RimI-like enzyme
VPGSVSIRPRLPSDMDACVSLLRDVYAQDGYPLAWPADPQAWLSGDRQVAAWIACRAQAICGHVALTRPRAGAAASAWARTLQVHEADLLCISLLFVAPQARGRGTGNRLLDAALAEAQARGAAAALEVITLNRQAIALYQARGWRHIGSVRYDWLPQNEQSLLFVPPDPGPS